MREKAFVRADGQLHREAAAEGIKSGWILDIFCKTGGAMTGKKRS